MKKEERRKSYKFTNPVFRSIFFFFLFSFFFLLLLCGCVTNYKVAVGFSPELKERFVEFPTLEVDIAAVTDTELEDIKQMGVEDYFAPGSGIREKLQVQTCFFSREEVHSFVLPSRAPIWFSWKQKEPTNVLVIASLPHDISMSDNADPRLLAVAAKRSYILARSLYVRVEPNRVIRVARPARSKRERKTNDPATGQWVEIRD